MTTNLKIKPDGKKGVKLTPILGSADSILSIRLEYRNLEAWDNAAADGVNGKKSPISFPVNDNAGNNLISYRIRKVEITGPTDVLTTFRNLILLKDDIKSIGDNARNKFDFQLIIDKDINNQSHHWNIVQPAGELSTWEKTLKLSVADFGGILDESKISIDDVKYHNEANNKIKVVEDRHEQKKALLDLENLIKNLCTKYSIDDPAYGWKNDKRGPDIELPHYIPELGDPRNSTTVPPTPATGLFAYLHGDNLNYYLGINNVPKKNDNVKHILYSLKTDPFEKLYGTDIWNFVCLFLEIQKNGNPLKLRRSQIIIFDYVGYKSEDDLEFFRELGFYKGFPLLDPNLQAIPDPTDGHKFKISKIDPDKPVRYTKENIDNFRNFATMGGYTGSNRDIFTKKKTIKDKDDNDIEVYANRLPEECLGFSPGDIYSNTANVYRHVNSNWTFQGQSKIYGDILFAQNAEEAMDLAFFGKDYDEPQSDKTTRKGNPNENYPGIVKVKNPNVNLQFNEVKGWTRLNTLNHYYEALQGFEDDKYCCSWRIPGDATGAGAKDAPKYNDLETKKKIDKGYNLAKEFITDYENWLSINISVYNETQLEVIKAKLEKWKTTRFYISGGVWVPVIDNFLTEVNNALSLLNGNPDNNDPEDGPKEDAPNIPAWKAELAELKTYGGELAQKIYQSCQPDQNGFTEAVFEELKKLVKLLEEAHGTKSANIPKAELEKFISDSNNDTNKKKALEVAKKVKNQESNNENCVATALEKLKTPSEKRLEQAHQKLKNLLAGLKINGKDAYEEVITAIKDSEIDLNKFIEIWKKCQEIDNATNDDNGELLDALNNFDNDSSNKKAWEAVNKYKKDGSLAGFASDMLKKLNDWTELRKKDYQDVKNAKSKFEFQIAKEEFVKKPEYQSNKTDYDEIYFPLSEKAAEIREKGNKSSSEEKDVAELITIVISEYTDWKTQLTDLENKLNKLKKYVESGEKYHIVKNYSTSEKAALIKLINKAEAKVREWKLEKSKSEKKNNSFQEIPPWYKTPIGIIGIILVLMLLVGTIYFVKQKVSEEK